MNWLNRLEARFPFLAVQSLPQIIVGGNVVAWIMALLSPTFLEVIDLDMSHVRMGQFWRLITFIFYPLSTVSSDVISILFFVMYVMLLLRILTGLERAWGAFGFTIYYAVGILGQAAAGLIAGTNDFGNGLLSATMLLAFAQFYPDEIIYLWFLPLKVKWLGWATVAVLLYEFVTLGWSFRLALLFAVANFLLFFSRDLIQAVRHQQQVASRRQRFDRQVREASSLVMHECAVCHRTDNTHPDLEFRVARDGNEYCLDHLPKPVAASS